MGTFRPRISASASSIKSSILKVDGRLFTLSDCNVMYQFVYSRCNVFLELRTSTRRSRLKLKYETRE